MEYRVFKLKKVAGGNCKVAGALSDRDNGSLVEWGCTPASSAERNGELPSEDFENQGATNQRSGGSVKTARENGERRILRSIQPRHIVLPSPSELKQQVTFVNSYS